MRHLMHLKLSMFERLICSCNAEMEKGPHECDVDLYLQQVGQCLNALL